MVARRIYPLALLLGWVTASGGESGVIVSIPTRAHVVALTFDACEAARVVHLDRAILDVLDHHPVPFTVFASGRFVQSNEKAIWELSRRPGVHIENHSWDHPRDMRELSDAEVKDQIRRTDELIEKVTGKRPTLLRFPGGNVDARLVQLAQYSGHEVVHWRWAEGDPVQSIDAQMMISQTLARTRAGDILIFHINGRGWHTAEALPDVLKGLEEKGYRFVDLVEALGVPKGPDSTDPINRK